MKLSVLSIAIAGTVLSTAALAQSKGEADYAEHCARVAPQGTAADQAATRQRCIEDAKKAAKTDVPGAANQPGTTATNKKATKAETQAAREKRKAEGAAVARQAKQDPKNPTN